jgi:translocation and assembly module TamA
MSFRSGVTLIGLFLLLCGSAAAEPPRLDIEITGVSGDLLGNVQANLSLYQQREHPLLNDALIQRLHKQAPDEIRHALEPFGYYRARSDSSLVRTETGWRAQYAIETGEPIRLAAVSIALEGAGATDIALQHWRAVFPLHEGDIPMKTPSRRCSGWRANAAISKESCWKTASRSISTATRRRSC